ncbi:MarR family winged helix-turn-helix transcriptional regulator [Paracidovorax anthurii]|uniref:DNA-binding MarR family transcriptional regulator n=1 Tax=Paracidovorax anthurii TaxID=78229 RepID=A0A328ZKD8_9BURK|nr:MarR family transcriptional regulator [Paracidovorax anthurii]RAR85825.1 DNA-binding MarR family transcriptional regulator [Paracidovorax anthurii]WCM92619.1 MarR family transcriptional regulator [Acidovorax sp. NCPPB 2350]
MQQTTRSAKTRGDRARPGNVAPVCPHAAPARADDPPEGELRPLPGLSYGVLDTLMGYALRRAQNALYLHFQQAVGEGVSPQRFAALVLVIANPGLRQGLLARAMGLHRSGGMRLVDWLHTQGWVLREADPQDRRSWTLHATPEGVQALEALTARVRAHDAALIAALGPEGAALQPLLERLASAGFPG